MSIKFKIHKSKDNQFFVTIVAKNGRVLFTSETYKRKRSALKAIADVQSPAEIIDNSN